MITIGIDPHKTTLTAVAVDPTGLQLADVRLAVTTTVEVQLLRFADGWPQRRWAVEGATGLGLGVAQQLTAAGETVLDVPPKLAARARLLNTGHGRKTDAVDAASVAAVAQRHHRLRQVQPEDHTVPLRLLSDHRDDLVSEHTRIINRLHRLLRELIPGGAKNQLSTLQAAQALRSVRPVTAADICRKQLARDLLDSLRRLDTRIKTLTKQITAAVEQTNTGLTEIRGIGPVVAAKIIGHSGDIHRFPDRNHYASYTGTAPLDASSGQQNRHRLSRLGNRQLNAAIHVIAVCQSSRPGPGRDLYLRKIAEGKTPNEARRTLKRRLSDTVYRRLVQDASTLPPPEA
jgi:transposase